MNKCFEEELSANVGTCQQQSNGVDYEVCAVANVFHSISAVNISAKRICKDHITPHLLRCLKSGHFNEFPSNKPDEKAVNCQEKKIKPDEKALHCQEKKRLNLMYFASADFHEYGITEKIKI